MINRKTSVMYCTYEAICFCVSALQVSHIYIALFYNIIMIRALNYSLMCNNVLQPYRQLQTLVIVTVTYIIIIIQNINIIISLYLKFKY